jgi:hypothetical protein
MKRPMRRMTDCARDASNFITADCKPVRCYRLLEKVEGTTRKSGRHNSSGEIRKCLSCVEYMQPLSLCTTTYGHTHEAWLTALTVTPHASHELHRARTARERQPPLPSCGLSTTLPAPTTAAYAAQTERTLAFLVRVSFLRALDASNTRGTNY